MGKGISPLIAAVMLIALTVSVAMLMMGWFSNLTKSTTESVSNKTTEAVGCTSARLSIDDLYITPGTDVNGSARAIVKNSGLDTLSVVGVQLYNKTGHNFSTGFAISYLSPGDIKTVYLTNVSVQSCPSDFSKVIATSGCGGVSAIFDGAPKCV